MTETIDFKLTLDANVANRALDETRKRAENLGGGLGSLQKGIGQLKERLEKQAAAIAVVSHAFGQHDSAIGKAVSSIGTLAAAYGAGGPFGLALAVAVPLVEKLGSAFDDFQASHQSYALSFDAIGRAAKAAHEASLAPMLATLQDLRRELNTMGMESIQVAYEDASAIVQSKRAGLERVTAERRAVQAGRMTPATAKMEGAQRDQYLPALIARQGEAEIALARAEAALAEIGDAAERIYAARRGGGSGVETDPKLLASEKKWQQGVIDARVADYLANRPDEDANFGMSLSGGFAPSMSTLAGAGAGSQERARGAGADEYGKTLALRQAMWGDHVLTMKETWKSAHNDMGTTGAAMYSGLLGSFQGYIDAKITGQKEAEAMLAAAALKTIGDQLVGFGTQQIFKGVGYMIESGGFDPRGAGLIALGTLATGAGVGMGAASAGIAHGAATRIDASEAADKEAARTSGVGGSRGGGRGSNYGGGGTNITIVYGGASGPTADDGARAVVGALRRAERRGFIQPRVL